MLHEGDALTEGKPRKTEGARKQLRKDLATFQNTVVTEGYGRVYGRVYGSCFSVLLSIVISLCLLGALKCHWSPEAEI